MRVLGVTGTIGSGKSTVCRILADLGCPVIDADIEAHRSYRKGTLAHRDIVAAFGEGILDQDGRIDRAILGSIVFGSPKARSRLNAITHPATRRRVERALRRLQESGHRWAAVEATLLIEAGWLDMVDQLWVVAAPDLSVVSRLRADRGQDEQRTRSRMAAQMSPRRMMEYADDIIYNDGGIEELRTRVQLLWLTLDEDATARVH